MAHQKMIDPKGILFLLPDCPGYFTHLIHRMGEVLKAKGYVPVFVSTSPFYEKFKHVNLSEVGKVYYLNEFLDTKVEKPEVNTLPINNWSYYASFSRQSYFFGRPLNRLSVLKKTKLCFQTILSENKIALLVSEGVSNSFLYLAHEEATTMNIPFFGLMGARIPYQFNVHVDVTGNEVLLNKEAPSEYLPTDQVPDYMKNSQFGGLFDREYSLFSFSFFKELWQFALLKRFYSLETGNTKSFLLKVYKITVKRIFADFYFRKILKTYALDVPLESGKIHVVYPLHFYPEASTSVFAKYYDGNEYNLIKNIAFSLPENTVLVVKEHKSNVGNNSRTFYRKVKQLPNVILLDPYFNLKDNLEKFDAVVTLSSTVGFEALTKDVPVYVLGDVFYQKYPGAHKINSYWDLEENLRAIQKKAASSGKNQTFNIYSTICFPGSFNYMDESCLNESNISLLLKPIVEYLETNKLDIHRNK